MALRNPDNQAATVLPLSRRSLPAADEHLRKWCPTVFEVEFLQAQWVPLASESRGKILVEVKLPGSNPRTYRIKTSGLHVSRRHAERFLRC